MSVSFTCSLDQRSIAACATMVTDAPPTGDTFVSVVYSGSEDPDVVLGRVVNACRDLVFHTARVVSTSITRLHFPAQSVTVTVWQRGED